MTTWCRDCTWTSESVSRVLADLELERHRREEHSGRSVPERLWDGTLELIHRINARAEVTVEQPDPHVHTWRCTYEVCGVGPTREDLANMTRLRYGRR